MSLSQRRANFLRDTANLSEAPTDKENVGPPGKLMGPGGLRKATFGRRVLGQVQNKLPETPQHDASQCFDAKDTSHTGRLGAPHKSLDRLCTPGNATGKAGLITPGPTPAPANQVSAKNLTAAVLQSFADKDYCRESSALEQSHLLGAFVERSVAAPGLSSL